MAALKPNKCAITITRSRKPQLKSTAALVNVAALVNRIASQDAPEYEKILLQLRALKERKMYSTALQLFKKGMAVIKHELQQNPNQSKLTSLSIARARYYHFAGAIMFELNKF